MTTRKRTAAIRILEILEEVCADRDPNITEISSRLDIPVPTIYRNIDSLLDSGFLSKDPAGRLCPGLRLRTLLFSSLFREPAVTRRRSILENLSAKIQETVSISVPYANSLIYFDRVESHWPLRFSVNVGDRLPIPGSASGKLYLSTMKDEDALAIFRENVSRPHAVNTIRDESLFLRELTRVRKSGYALDDEEFFDGMIGAAVPIRDSRDEIRAYLSTHCLKTRKSMEVLKSELPSLFEVARLLQDLYSDDVTTDPVTLT